MSDLMKLMMSDYKVEMINDAFRSFMSISNDTKPSITHLSGSVVINQTWSPMFDLVNLFLLLYPNSSDPLNGEAAALMMHDQTAYEHKVKEHCHKYTEPEEDTNPEHKSSDDEEELSEAESDSTNGHALVDP